MQILRNLRGRRLEERTPAERAQSRFIAAVAIFVVAVLSYSIFSVFRSRMSGKFIHTAVAHRGSVELRVKGQATIVRDEKVGVTPISGALHILVPAGEKVSAGAPIAEIRDQVALEAVSPDADPEASDAERRVQEAALLEKRERERAAALRVQIAIKEDELRTYEARQDSKNVKKIQSELASLRLRESQAALAVDMAEREARAAEEALSRARSESDAALGRALSILRASEASVISYYTDGLESVFRPDDADLLTLSPLDYAPEPRTRVEGQQVTAGSVVFREIQNYRTNLLIIADFGSSEAPRAPGQGARVRVRFPKLATEAVGATVLSSSSRPDLGEHAWALHVALDRYATSLADIRSTQVELITGYAKGIVVPASAVVRDGGSDGVYVLRANRLAFKPVAVIGANSDDVAVEGIQEGDIVRVRP